MRAYRHSPLQRTVAAGPPLEEGWRREAEPNLVYRKSLRSDREAWKKMREDRAACRGVFRTATNCVQCRHRQGSERTGSTHYTKYYGTGREAAARPQPPASAAARCHVDVPALEASARLAEADTIGSYDDTKGLNVFQANTAGCCDLFDDPGSRGSTSGTWSAARDTGGGGRSARPFRAGAAHPADRQRGGLRKSCASGNFNLGRARRVLAYARKPWYTSTSPCPNLVDWRPRSRKNSPSR